MEDMDYMIPVGYDEVNAKKNIKRNKKILKIVLIILFIGGIIYLVF